MRTDSVRCNKKGKTMRILRTETVELSKLQTNLFVHQSLDEDHVLFLGGLYEGGQKFDPIDVNEEYCIVDGRHRSRMYDLFDVKSVEVRVILFSNQIEMIGYAFQANNKGGPKPPSASDLEHTIEQLIELNQNNKAISDTLGLPAKMVRKFIDNVRSRLARAKLMRAASSITDGGLTIAKAAELHSVDPEKLKEILSGRRRKHKTNGVGDIQRQLTYSYKSVSLKNAAVLKKISVMYDDGDMSEKQARDIINHLGTLQRQSSKAFNDHKARLEAKFNLGKSAKVV